MSLYTTTTVAAATLPQPALHHSGADQLCYLYCTHCDTLLAVSVPCTSLFKKVTVRCGHCTNLLPVTTMCGLMLPPPPVNQFHFGHSFLSPSTHDGLEDDQNQNESSNFLMNQNLQNNDLPKPPVITRTPEKRQRVRSTYNRFIKEEIQRIKARNPDISHREAFSAAAKNWAHIPHIHSGLTADKTNAAVNQTSMRSQETEGGLMKESFFAAANIGVSHY